jgi:glycosyltransferase involved in cell wall biosynthesis
MKVLIDARMNPGENGGVEQAIIGLIRSYSVPQNSDIDPYFLVFPSGKVWIQQFVKDDERIIVTELPKRSWVFPQRLTYLRKMKLVNYIISLIRRAGVFGFDLVTEPPEVRRIDPDVIHFPLQIGFQTEYPNIYQPHDLQHITFPQFFTREELLARSIIYSRMIKQAGAIIVGNEWTKRDVSKAFPNQKFVLANVPVMPQLPQSKALKPEIDENSIKLLYPASFWPHKNHDNLFASIRILRDQGYNVLLTCTGARISDNRHLHKKVKKLNLEDSVCLRGFLPREELDALYGSSDILVMPSYFESESLPIWEAFFHGTPVVASRITAIPDQVRSAAILFDPKNPYEIAEAILRVQSDVVLRNKMLNEGEFLVSQLTELNTFIGYRYHYRRLLNQYLDHLDEEWLSKGFRF